MLLTNPYLRLNILSVSEGVCTYLVCVYEWMCVCVRVCVYACVLGHPTLFGTKTFRESLIFSILPVGQWLCSVVPAF